MRCHSVLLYDTNEVQTKLIWNNSLPALLQNIWMHRKCMKGFVKGLCLVTCRSDWNSESKKIDRSNWKCIILIQKKQKVNWLYSVIFQTFQKFIFFDILKLRHQFLSSVAMKQTRTRADKFKCLPHLACINPTLLFVEYCSVLGQ